MEYKGLSLAEAAATAIDRVTSTQGEGGLIAVDAQGNIAMPFNSEGMYRAFQVSDGQSGMAIYK